ncbi:RidA family protein [Helicobacter sp. MIT 14-3879]|uniref:RidA family protein n=1 Tax=Helicobacter sp. MIT 14-3879 TaxID=2040649 RepID=UPI000E1E6650|nr:RidA family protein [Helicobacter sp. MIT 14-3879]RDU63155.1 deaminase [Helicobacter sp. MIT 14-3879]
MKEIITISTQNAPQAIGPYSQAKQFENLIFVSGQIPLNNKGEFIKGDIKVQTKQVLENLSAVLKEANSSLNNVIKTSVFLTNMDDFIAMNEVYESYFGENKPARSTICVKELPRKALVEIECIAVRL